MDVKKLDIKKLQKQKDRLSKAVDPVTKFEARQKRAMARVDRLIEKATSAAKAEVRK